MLWNILKVVQFISVANNKCIHASKCEVYVLFWKLQGKTLHELTATEGITFIVYNITKFKELCLNYQDEKYVCYVDRILNIIEICTEL